MKNADIIEILERFAPLSVAEEWDRVGLMVGSKNRENTGVLLTLDVTPESIEEAERRRANLIVSHHPFIWDGLKRIDEDDVRGAMIARLIRAGISVYSMHTNLDKTVGGINDYLAEMLGGTDIYPEGIGRTFATGDLTLKDLARRVADRLGDNTVLVVGDGNRVIKRAFVVGGAGGSEYAKAKETSDALITGDIAHHLLVDAAAEGFCLVQFSHYYSEIIVQDILSRVLAAYPINIFKAARNCPFRRSEEL